MRYVLAVIMMCATGMACASDRAVEAAVIASFDKMPVVERVVDVSQVCGANGKANPDVVYCTTQNRVYLRIGSDSSAYKLAHVMGHAAQVQHGIADIALREIRKRPDEEMELRGLVTRQVECLAGFYLAQAGLDAPDLSVAFEVEPFTGSHWGRSPLKIGPKVSIGTQARMEWLEIGHWAKSLDACSVGEMSSQLLVRAYKG